MPHSVWEKTRQVNLDGSFYVTQGVIFRWHYLKHDTYTTLLVYSRGQPDAKANAPRRINYWYIIDICLGWRRATVVSSIWWSCIVLHRILFSHYTPTKAGILSLMQSCAVALGKYNIRANAILPGTIATDINKEDLSDEAKRAGMVKRTCLGRLGCALFGQLSGSVYTDTVYLAPDDIAGPVVFLASDLAKYVTGASLLVDGGLFVNLQ